MEVWRIPPPGSHRSYRPDRIEIGVSSSFQIPFNRQQMADYLNLDRSALSKELGKMRDEGLITFHKNQFTLLHPALNESH